MTQNTELKPGAEKNPMHNAFSRGGRLGRRSIMAKQSPTLMGLGPKYYIQGSFNLIHSHKLFFFISLQRTVSVFFYDVGSALE